jgi:hypothetical protein
LEAWLSETFLNARAVNRLVDEPEVGVDQRVVNIVGYSHFETIFRDRESAELAKVASFFLFGILGLILHMIQTMVYRRMVAHCLGAGVRSLLFLNL